MKNLQNILGIVFFILLILACNDSKEINSYENIDTIKTIDTNKIIYKGCDGQTYPDPSNSTYILPFPVGTTIKTGLTNCSSSFHSSGNPDQYAFDFNMQTGTKFYAARKGVVTKVVEDQSSAGGGQGNLVLVNHGDNTSAYYLHSPENGIFVNVGDTVNQGDLLGEVGRSGLAGYSHLHFIVVEGNTTYPYSGVAISFKNVLPRDVVLKVILNI